jgi:hypothetical protein
LVGLGLQPAAKLLKAQQSCVSSAIYFRCIFTEDQAEQQLDSWQLLSMAKELR